MTSARKTLKAPPREPDAIVRPLRVSDYVTFVACGAFLFYVGMMLLPSIGG